MACHVELILTSRRPVISKPEGGHYRLGGSVYNADLIQVLRQHRSFRLTHWPPVGAFGCAIPNPRALLPHAAGGITIRDPGGLVLRSRLPGVNLGLVHHLNYELAEQSAYYRWLFARINRALVRQDWVVVVSEYWKRRLAEIGCRQVHVIHNCFDVALCDGLRTEKRRLREIVGLPQAGTVVYIGNASQGKGTRDVFEALKDRSHTMVYSGREPMAGIGARFYNLEYREYLCLLGACDCAVCMSEQTEGWTRTAHEALLMGTPVVGSGTGGMRELLEGGSQVICTEKADIRDKVEQTLSAREALAASGHRFAAQFTTERFRREWVSFLTSVLGEDFVPSDGKP